jgi:hypothetical protein
MKNHLTTFIICLFILSFFNGCASTSSARLLTESSSEEVTKVNFNDYQITKYSDQMAFELKSNDDSIHTYRVYGFCYEKQNDLLIMSQREGWDGNYSNSTFTIKRDRIKICRNNKVKNPNLENQSTGLVSSIIGFGLGFGITTASLASYNLGGALLLGSLVGGTTSVIILATQKSLDLPGDKEECAEYYSTPEEEFKFLNDHLCVKE